MTLDPRKRFSNRVDDYIKYRPSYPPEVIHLLQDTCGLSGASVVADIGSGTGILTKLLLDAAQAVYGVEPNPEMRTAAEVMLENVSNFISIAGTAENTQLDDESIDIITSAQAFHWFRLQETAAEFRRILKPGGWIALIWNERLKEASEFQKTYERLLIKYAPDYNAKNHKGVGDGELRDFFRPGSFRTKVFSYQQTFDFPGLKGRLLSASYTPKAGEPNHDSLFQALEAAYKENEKDGCITIDYATNVYLGQFG